MVTWLFSARHSLVSNYRFPSGDAAAPDLISYYSRKHLRRSENPYVENCASMCVLPVTARIVLRSVRFVRPSVQPPSARLRPSQGVPRFFSFIDAGQEAARIPGSSHLSCYVPDRRRVGAPRPLAAEARNDTLLARTCQTQPLLFPLARVTT